MKSNNNIISIEERTGLNKYAKVSYPARYGKYIEIFTRDYIYEFDLNGGIKFITGRGREWPHGDWLKRTKGNDWIFYTAGEYSNIFPYAGEYYTPCLNYESNPFFSYRPFENRLVYEAIDSLQSLYSALKKTSFISTHEKIIKRIIESEHPSGKSLHNITGEISVLPPDARHSDYDVIPVVTVDGCIYNCSFCSVKSGDKISVRSRGDILKQLKELKDFYAEDIINYNSLFLGNHDFLFADAGTIEFVINESYKPIENSYMKGASLYAFASIFSFLNTNDDLFKILNGSPYQSYINIGFESFDQATLDIIGKPVSAKESKEAFIRLIDVNKTFHNIELTSNFILGSNLPASHFKSMEKVINDNIAGRCIKGCVYLSPLIGEHNNNFIKSAFRTLKTNIKMPVYVYLIQRL